VPGVGGGDGGLRMVQLMKQQSYVGESLALAILLCCLPLASCGNEIQDRYPVETGFGKLCAGVQVQVSVLDGKEHPVKSAQVLAVSEDWGVRLPVTGGPFAYTDERGTAKLTLFQGRWLVLAAYAAAPGEGGFLGKHVVLGSDPLTVSLKPDSFVDVDLPADAQRVFAMEASCVPFAAMPSCGVSSAGRLRLHSTNGLQQRLLFIRYPGDGPGFLLLSPPVGSGESLQMSLQDEELGRMVFDIQDNNDPDGTMVVGIGYPTADMDQGTQITHFKAKGIQELLVTPGVVDYYLAYFRPGGCGYWFKRKSVTLGVGQRIDVRGGGPLHTSVLASKGRESQNAINLLLDARDSFGNVLDYYSLGSRSEPVVGIHLFDEVSTPASSTSCYSYDALRLRIPLPQAPLESLRYEVDWDLGVFGSKTLSGPLFTPETAYGFDHLVSIHFDGYFPFGYGEQGSQVLARLEGAYAFMADYVGCAPQDQVNIYVPLYPDGGVGQSSGNDVFIWMDGFLCWNPGDPVNSWEGILFHELGHHMEVIYSCNSAPINGSRNEALASVLSAQSLDSLGDAGKASLLRTRECQWFLQHVEGTFPDSSPDYELFINRFLLHIYLPKVFGQNIHSSFFKDWIESWRALADFSEADAFVTLYSLHCRKNLADAFRAIGYTTTADRVYEGLNRLENLLPVGIGGQ
jgi:hypothetical protein